jgi:hypothetical protein
MLSVILVTALSAVGDVPARTPQAYAPVAGRTHTVGKAVSSSSYFGPLDSYCPTTDFSCGGYGCCPVDNVSLFMPCPGVPGCPPFAPGAPRPVCAPRVNYYSCPTPVRTCPCPPPRCPAPCP